MVFQKPVIVIDNGTDIEKEKTIYFSFASFLFEFFGGDVVVRG